MSGNSSRPRLRFDVGTGAAVVVVSGAVVTVVATVVVSTGTDAVSTVVGRLLPPAAWCSTPGRGAEPG